MALELASRACVPCRGGVAPLESSEAERLRAEVPAWTLVDGTRIERRYPFRNFAGALDFVRAASELAEAEGHHPDICFGWGYATMSLQTKKIKGLHENDFIMAAKLDRIPSAGVNSPEA